MTVSSLISHHNLPAAERTLVAPRNSDQAVPVWSVMIPTYNCAHYLAQTLQSVLTQDQDFDRMQIDVVDDHSDDDPERVVRQLGQGRVGFYRQVRNVGHVENFATCLNRARGRLVHLLHGDDYVRPGFYTSMEAAFQCEPLPGAAFCRHIYMGAGGHWRGLAPLEQSHSGLLDNALERLAVEQRVMTPAMVVRREVYEQLGGFDRRLVCSEDWEMWVRIAAQYPIWYETEPLAVYRMHDTSNTARHLRSGVDAAYTRMAIDLFRAYLPSDRAEHITTQARTVYARSTLALAASMLAAGDTTAACVLVREAWRFRRSPHVVIGTLRLLARAIQREAKHRLPDRTR